MIYKSTRNSYEVLDVEGYTFEIICFIETRPGREATFIVNGEFLYSRSGEELDTDYEIKNIELVYEDGSTLNSRNTITFNHLDTEELTEVCINWANKNWDTEDDYDDTGEAGYCGY